MHRAGSVKRCFAETARIPFFQPKVDKYKTLILHPGPPINVLCTFNVLWTCFFLSVRKFWIFFFFKKSVFEHRNLNFRQISIKLWENILICGLFR